MSKTIVDSLFNQIAHSDFIDTIPNQTIKTMLQGYEQTNKNNR
jgi:hypothetical protein